MTPAEKKQAAKEFVRRWQEAEGNEDREARSFWIELCQDVFGVDDPTKNKLDFEKRVQGRKVDVFFEDMGILIENKSRGIDLDHQRDNGKKYGFETPYQQAHWYYANMPKSIAPRWLVLMNFDTFRIHDLNSDNPETDYIEIQLSELPEQYHLFNFFINTKESRLVKEEELSVKAGEIVGRLYSQLSTQYKNIETDEHEQRSLNVLIVRLVFLLYAEDADLLQERDAFLNYMRDIPTASMRNAIIELFKVLDTKPEERDQYLDEKLLAFPYINGGLFAQEDILIPQFTESIRLDLLLEASQKFNWRDISPTIFGAAFESTLNPKTRHEGGMHYTTIEYIHKIIDPLFLDDLKQELSVIEGESIAKNRKVKLLAFQKKLSELKIFDPACGSGNFLTESYLSLRKLENRVIENLQGEQMAIGFDGDADPIKVQISQFYGIEINDFAVSVARTALWIAEEQAMEQTQEIMLKAFDFFPLKTNANIHEDNAIQKDWNEVLPAVDCSFICGNPPFAGKLTKAQKDDREKCFGKVRTLDYVACWYKLAAEYMKQNKKVRTAFVSTNSICQGQQVKPLWMPLFDDGISIDFAYQSFKWKSEANDAAGVTVIIVGFSYQDIYPKILFTKVGHENPENINGYLLAMNNVYIPIRKKPLSEVPKMASGFKAADNGFLILDQEECTAMLASNAKTEKWIRPYSMGDELINGTPRYCLWLEGITSQELDELPKIKERVKACREWREQQTITGDAYKLRDTPHLFRPCKQFQDVNYLAVPLVSGETRDYIPICFLNDGTIPGNNLFAVFNANLYHFGIITSQTHMAWMRTVGGKLETRYRYSKDLVYNNFIWPEPTTEQRIIIEKYAQSILDIRDSYPDKSLADLYDQEKMPKELLSAHKELDAAVEDAYGVSFDGDEDQIVAHLFNLYNEATKEE